MNLEILYIYKENSSLWEKEDSLHLGLKEL